MLPMPHISRREILGGVTFAGVAISAGCLGDALGTGEGFENEVHEQQDAYRSDAQPHDFDLVRGPHIDCGSLPEWMEDAEVENDLTEEEREVVVEQETERRKQQREIAGGSCSFDPEAIDRVEESDEAPAAAGNWYGFVVGGLSEWEELILDNFTEDDREFLNATDRESDTLLLFQTSFGTVSSFAFEFVGELHDDERATYVEIDSTTTYDDDPTAVRSLLRVPEVSLPRSLIVGQRIEHVAEGTSGHLIWQNDSA